MKLKYFDISWFSTVDGPGTRVVLFLQGCHLRCPWCHSPHSWKTESPLLFFENHCLLCGSCVRECPNHVHHIADRIHFLDRTKCTQCRACIESCPVSESTKWNTGALGFAGDEMEVHDLFHLLKPQLDVLKGFGGITVSGGDPLLQSEALAGFLKICSREGVHIAVETSATLDSAYMELIEPYIDHWLIGLRPSSIDKQIDWEKLLENIGLLSARDSRKITVRTPIIPGFTDAQECHEKIISVMLSNGIKSIEILPYNPYSENYYKAMDLEFPLEGTQPLDDQKINKIKCLFTSAGIDTKIVE